MSTEAFFQWQGETWYRIDDARQMPEFFMTLVSPSNHWMFLSSKGALTAGRVDPEHALFPYSTVDKIYASRGHNGPRTIIRVSGQNKIWEPFADWTDQVWSTRQALARNALGSRVVFFETNLDLGLEFAYSWAFSRRYGFVRTSYLRNLREEPASVEVLDALLNIVSTGVSRAQITEFSSLIDAYKDNVLVNPRLAVFSLSALVTDKAEAAEALHASVAWTIGKEENLRTSLDNRAINQFINGEAWTDAPRVCGQTNDFLCLRKFILGGMESGHWDMVADRDLDGVAVDRLAQLLSGSDFGHDDLFGDIAQGETDLQYLVKRSDAWSLSAQPMQAWHHQSNVLFNIMRGGIPWHDNQVEIADVVEFVAVRNKSAASLAQNLLGSSGRIGYRELRTRLLSAANPDLARLGGEYLPLTFSRRHGDPSRPWNNFAIRVEDRQGKAVVQYQGNWRDIFQNWEALALSFPDFLPAFIACFLNATSLDGYNPYRVTREGSEWEKLEPHNPWSNIGYWSDHQIIYLQKLLELAEAYQPGWLAQTMDEARYSYSAIPYRLADFAAICRDPQHTIRFDETADQAIEARRAVEGNDARLVHAADGSVYHGSLLEKILSLVLAKVANLVPGGGIWMNTQRPEWNDANNALVGNGLSIVSLAQLRRAIVFWQGIFHAAPSGTYTIPGELASFAAKAAEILQHFDPQTCAQNPSDRWNFMQEIGIAASDYRNAVYRDWRFGAERKSIQPAELLTLFGVALGHIDASLAPQQRPDGLFHSYNILTIDQSAKPVQARIRTLNLMLEGQVAILGAGYLGAAKTLALVQSLRKSALFRSDQYSYMLYPEKELPDFVAKNHPDQAKLRANPLVQKLLSAQNPTIVAEGPAGLRFAAGISNRRLLHDALAKLGQIPDWSQLVAAQQAEIHAIYEQCFDHQAYLGRSGTMYAYEGIGSIYWHMVSKLLAVVAENIAQQSDQKLQQELGLAYLDIREGLGYRKSAMQYGAFPWEPYSHTPAGAGARQPGMTGQVKEEVITRFWEYGLRVERGCLAFAAAPLLRDEVLPLENDKAWSGLLVPAGHFACMVCGVPVIRSAQAISKLEICQSDVWTTVKGNILPRELSDALFGRLGKISVIRAS